MPADHSDGVGVYRVLPPSRIFLRTVRWAEQRLGRAGNLAWLHVFLGNAVRAADDWFDGDYAYREYLRDIKQLNKDVEEFIVALEKFRLVVSGKGTVRPKWWSDIRSIRPDELREWATKVREHTFKAKRGRPSDWRFYFVSSLIEAFYALTKAKPPSSLQSMEGPWAEFVEVVFADLDVRPPNFTTLNRYVRKRQGSYKHQVDIAKAMQAAGGLKDPELESLLKNVPQPPPPPAAPC